jgi:protein-disulfide isomerase
VTRRSVALVAGLVAGLAMLPALAAWGVGAQPGAPGGAAPPPAKPSPPMVLGSARAKITVVEYASVGCPHCAVWANTVFPVFRSKYIDTGKVRFEFHEMLTGNPALAAAGFLIARCAVRTKYFQVVDDVFARQDEIGDKGVAVLEEIGEHAGLTQAQVQACLQNTAALEALNSRTMEDAKAHGVTGTPTFFVGEEKLNGEQPLEALDAAIARAQASVKP